MFPVRTAVRPAIVLLTAAVLSACTINIGTAGDDHGPGMHGGSSASAGAPAGEEASEVNMSDVMFAQMMIPHHEQAVEMAELAAPAGASPQVQALADEIAAAQGPEIAQMEAMLDRWGVSQMMDHSGHQMDGMVSEADMERLRAATGADFDRLFLEFMIAHHEGAIAMTEDPLANGSDAELRTLLQSIVTTQSAEIERMRQMLATM